MTVSSTPSCRRQTPERRRGAPWGQLPVLLWGLALWLLVLLLPGAAAPAHAQVPGEVVQMQLERTDEGLLLSAGLRFELPDVVEDALRKGIPMYFITEAEVLRERWYWSDKSVAHAWRYLRLSYQPLTRRWRLNISATPFTNAGLGMALGQSFEDYEEALAAMQRLARWKIAEVADVDDDARYVVQLRFRVDLSQLPRPFQISAASPRSGWNLLVSRTQRLPPEPAQP